MERKSPGGVGMVLACRYSFYSVILDINLNYSVTMTENRWTNDAICHQWFNKVFLPFVKNRGDKTKHILLIMDGHGSHETLEMLDYAEANNVMLLRLPAHTTHELQPLDVGAFGPLQSSWIQHCEKMGMKRGEIARETVIPGYMKVSSIYCFYLMCPVNINCMLLIDLGQIYDQSINSICF